MSAMTNKEVREKIAGNIRVLNKIHGYSAYDLAVKYGFVGTEKEWLESNSAYGVAVANGYKGSKDEWLASLKGDKGEAGSLQLFGEFDAMNHRVENVLDPTGDNDAANKKYVDDAIAGAKEYVDNKNSASKEYISENYVSKEDQLDANEKTVTNVADPVNDNDAVNKKYVHDNFQPLKGEDISDKIIAQSYSGYTVTSVKAIRQQNIISGVISVRGNFTGDGVNGNLNMVLCLDSHYRPLSPTICPSMVRTTVDGKAILYIEDTPNVHIDSAAGVVTVGYYGDNQNFSNEVVFSFTYLYNE